MREQPIEGLTTAALASSRQERSGSDPAREIAQTAEDANWEEQMLVDDRVLHLITLGVIGLAFLSVLPVSLMLLFGS